MNKQNSSNLTRISIGFFLIGFILLLNNMNIQITLSYIVVELFGNESTFEYGLLNTMVFVGNIIALYPLLKISEKWGRKNTMIFSIGLATIATFLFYFGRSYWILLILQICVGFNSIIGLISACICDHWLERERGKPLSLYTVGVVLGYLVGSVLGGILHNLFGNQNLFLISGGLMLSCIISVMIFIKDPPQTNAQECEDPILIKKVDTWSYIKENKRIFGILVINLFATLVMGGGGSYAINFLFSYGYEKFDLNSNIAGFYLIPVQLIEVGIFLLLGAKFKRFEKPYRILLIVCGIIFAFGILFIFFEAAWAFSICISVVGAGTAIMLQSADTLSHDLILPEHKTNMVSIYRMVGLIGNALGPALFGLFSRPWIYLPGYFILILMLITEVIYWKWIRKRN
jgi:MFS transporter, DHA1 family, multidrug resistance protein